MSKTSANPTPPPIVRFAPAPTGRLHVGNIRPAILNWLFARKNGGTFILRMDDTDVARSKEEYIEAIRADLTWLGLTWDREERQSARTTRYEEMAAKLREAGRLYPCYETEDGTRPPPQAPARAWAAADLRPRCAETHGRGARKTRSRGSQAALALPPCQHQSRVGSHSQPTLKSWNDLIRGDQLVDIGSLSDPVLIREDGSFLYMFPSVVDDIDFGITHVIRGDDHVTNSGVQIDLFEALGAVPPAFAHHSLLIGSDGQALSKRLDSLSIGGMREGGLEALAIACHAALVGTSDAIEPKPSLVALAEGFDFAKISTAPGRFDEGELATLNAKIVHQKSFAEVAPRLNALGVGGGEAFWLAIRGNLTKLADAIGWWQVVAGEITPVIENATFTTAAAGLLPPEPWDQYDVEHLHQRRESCHRRERPCAVPPATAGIDRPRRRPGAEEPAAADRTRPGGAQADGASGLTGEAAVGRHVDRPTSAADPNRTTNSACPLSHLDNDLTLRPALI